MRFPVIRPFKTEKGAVVVPGCFVEMDPATAARYRRAGVIGGPERAVNPPPLRPMPDKSEQAVKKPGERRGRKPKAMEPQIPEPQETVQDGVETHNTTGD